MSRGARGQACPFFGQGCNIVGRSSHATHLGVPNAAAGAVGYAAMAALALWAGGEPPERRPLQPPLVEQATAMNGEGNP